MLCTSSAVLLGLTACQKDSDPTAPIDTPSLASAKKTPTYLISLGTSAPADLAARLERVGGKVKKINFEAGLATVESDAADFASKAKALPGVAGVGRDKVIQWVDPNLRVVEASHGSDETFFNSQWAPGSIQAPEAWHTGAIGTGARVAVLDGGVNPNHIDLVGGVDVACSFSAVDGFAFNQDIGGFSHATHVSGIVAAHDNGVGTIGIAPGATIMGVKVLQAGSGSFEDVIEGIMYAADPSTGGKPACARADVINMSLGATFIPVPEDGDLELIKALDQATKFAWKKGVTVIASSGNDATNHDKGSPWVTVPAQSQHVIAVSATGPFGFAIGYPNGATNFSRPASYTNFGKSVVDLAGPGGDFAVPDDANGDGVINAGDNCAIPRIPVGNVVFPCWVFDMVVSPGSITTNTGYSWAAGTSMAAPAVAGVAALIIGKNPGLTPAQVEAKLRQSATDEGKPGNDEFYGQGFVNALRAVQ
jgi:subtilisin family serine protease